MTNEEIANEIAERKAAIEVLSNEIADLKDRFTGGRKVGDVVEIPDGRDKGRYVLAWAPFEDDGKQPIWRMKVKKLKKDGTPSLHSQHFYGGETAVWTGERIELSEQPR